MIEQAKGVLVGARWRVDPRRAFEELGAPWEGHGGRCLTAAAGMGTRFEPACSCG